MNKPTCDEWSTISEHRLVGLADGLTAPDAVDIALDIIAAATLPTACPHLRVGEYGGDGHRWTHCALAEQQGRVAEAARAFADVTLGLENTVEGAALLVALEAMNDRNTIR